ncbi:MAG: macrocin-O-methyltransferase [Chloroflexi bacterium]|nr:macrocin-O-methyltransferase [Chloroflexota bacterium]|tara:strand:- start:28743 stop:29444 length:702 start_codon:yes stop_codon:yes gene_type:complete
MVNKTRKIVYNSKNIGSILSKFATSFQFKLLSFYKDEDIVELIKKIKKEVDFAFYPYEAFMIYSIVRSQLDVEGDLAEVGVYQGGSAKLICEIKKNKNLYLFDTFTGLPGVSEMDTHFGEKHWYENEFSNTSVESIKKLLSKYENVHIIKGIFPESGKSVTEKKFCFVHLDVDLYKSTIDSLRFFFPKIVKGGIILIHDFHSDGIQKAFNEFKNENEIKLIELTGSQAMIIKN